MEQLQFDVKQVAIYLRKSRGDENTDDDLRKHRTALVSLAESNGWKYDIYEEIASGATIEFRPKMQELLKHIGRGMYDGVCVVDYDRLTRSGGIDQAVIKDAFLKSDTLLITPSKTYNFNNDADDMLTEVQGFVSKFEYRAIKKRLRQGKLRGANSGDWVNGTPPYGYVYNADTKRLNVVEEKRHIVKHVVSQVLQGKPMYVIATELNQQGYRTNKNGIWTDVAVHRLISNETYLGKTIYGKTSGSGHLHKPTAELKKNDRSDWIIVEGTHEALITEEQFDKIRVILERNRLIKSKAVRGSHKLSATVRCGKCGASMSFVAKYYGGVDHVSVKTCQNRDFLTGERCGGKGIKEEIVLEALYDSLRAYEQELAQETTGDNSSEIERLTALIDDREKHLAKLNSALEKVQDMYEMGDIDRDSYLSRKQKRQSEISETVTLIEDTRRQLRHYENQTTQDKLANLRSLFEVWETADNETINRLLKAVVSKVVLHVEEVGSRQYGVRIEVEYN